MMQIVIEIPEERLKSIRRFGIKKNEVYMLIKAILEGAPLPRHHGDLIDRNEAIKSLFDYHNGKKTIGQCIDDIQTIIEADEESEVKE